MPLQAYLYTATVGYSVSLIVYNEIIHWLNEYIGLPNKEYILLGPYIHFKAKESLTLFLFRWGEVAELFKIVKDSYDNR
jgi:hypothetical protein